MDQATLAPFDIAAVLILIAAVLGYANHRFLKLPSAVGLTLMGALASLAIIGIGAVFPSWGLAPMVEQFLSGIDFHATLMEGMLSFLLFAGALHVDWTQMRANRLLVFSLATFGVLISTGLVGFGTCWIAQAMGFSVPLAWTLVFGALISPTDPVAVMAILKRAAVPPSLQATVAGESLFNDGVGVVIFAILLAVATGEGTGGQDRAAVDREGDPEGGQDEVGDVGDPDAGQAQLGQAARDVADARDAVGVERRRRRDDDGADHEEQRTGQLRRHRLQAEEERQRTERLREEQRLAEEARRNAMSDTARMEQAFAASYRRPPGCAEAATLECANHYIRAKRAFEAQYAREQAKPRTASAP